MQSRILGEIHEKDFFFYYYFLSPDQVSSCSYDLSLTGSELSPTDISTLASNSVQEKQINRLKQLVMRLLRFPLHAVTEIYLSSDVVCFCLQNMVLNCAAKLWYKFGFPQLQASQGIPFCPFPILGRCQQHSCTSEPFTEASTLFLLLLVVFLSYIVVPDDVFTFQFHIQTTSTARGSKIQ